MLKTTCSLLMIGSFVGVGCVGMDELTGEGEQASKGKGGSAEVVPAGSHEGVVPVSFAGNFVAADDDQICYEIAEQGDLEITSEMRGFKNDNPTAGSTHTQAGISATVSANGKFLSWESATAKVVAVVVKGADAFNLYDYLTHFGGLNAIPSSDSLLHSPLKNGKIPAISHYNFCYSPPPPSGGAEGCTPGYWRNHVDRWEGAATSDDFDATFGVDLFEPNITLGAAIWATGGGADALARHATAALLNSFGGVPNADGELVNYAYTTAEVIQMVQDAVANGTIDATKDLFDAANNAGCPLEGTNATKK
jgi:hypothetical protein